MFPDSQVPSKFSSSLVCKFIILKPGLTASVQIHTNYTVQIVFHWHWEHQIKKLNLGISEKGNSHSKKRNKKEIVW